MQEWELLLEGDLWSLAKADLWDVTGGDLRLFLAAYLGVVIVLLVAATRIRLIENLRIKTVLLTAFGWPVFVPLFAWRILSRR
jgi:hypothetical protein